MSPLLQRTPLSSSQRSRWSTPSTGGRVGRTWPCFLKALASEGVAVLMEDFTFVAGEEDTRVLVEGLVVLKATSDDQKVHSVETDLELAQCLQRLESPTIRKSLKHLDAASSDPTTNPKPPTVIPLMLLFQRDRPCEGRLKKTSSGQEKKKKIK